MLCAFVMEEQISSRCPSKFFTLSLSGVNINLVSVKPTIKGQINKST